MLKLAQTNRFCEFAYISVESSSDYANKDTK